MATAVFASDVHLNRRDPASLERWGRFMEWLRGRAGGGEDLELYVLGDLFEFYHEWLGRPHRGYEGVLAEIRRTVEAGCPVRILAGNRDFLYGRGLAATGAEFLGDTLEIEIHGRRLYVSHGDELCTRQRLYMLWRALVRSRPLMGLMRLVPRTIAFAGADLAMAVSSFLKRNLGLEVLDLQARAAGEVARRGFDLMICGHIHVRRWACFLPRDLGCQIVNLPAWCEGHRPEVLELSADGASFVDPFGASEGAQ